MFIYWMLIPKHQFYFINIFIIITPTKLTTKWHEF